MTTEGGAEGAPHRYSDKELAWMGEHLTQMRQSALGQRMVLWSLGLGFVLPPALRSNSITALWLPTGRTYSALHDALKARGFVIYEGQGRLACEIFRVANMGQLTREDLARFLDVLGGALGS